jgi:YidC/Oxa1 family membrane protein insertase
MEFRRVGSDGLEIVKRYELLEDPFLARVTVSWRNLGARPLSGDLWVGMENAEHLDAGRYSNERRPQAFVEGSFLEISDVKKLASKPTEKEGPLTWFGEGNRYFLTALLPADPNLGALRVTATGNRVHVTQVVRGITLEPGATRVAEYTLFAGPKRSNILKNVGFNVDKSVQYGWFGFFARILLWLLQQFHRVTQNWGLAIILLTVFVKLVFYPLTQKSYRSSKEMQRIQPLMNEIKQKYKDKPDLQNQETMKLLQEHKVNPLGGCLPTLVQLPVWMALYSVLLNSVDLYHSRFLFYTDLSAQDPYAILPILVGVLMFVQQRITPMTGMDPTQAKMMQFMPLVFCFFIFSFPSGLGLYILVNSILSIAQQKLIDRSYKKSMA